MEDSSLAEIDRLRLAADVIAALDQHGLSYSAAIERHPDLDRSMLSRACNAKPLSAANHLLVCWAFGLDPFAYLLHPRGQRTTLRAILKHMEKQPVAAGVSREAEARP